MSGQLQTVVCQRCGCAFAVTDNYCDFLERHGVSVIVPVICAACFLRGGPLPKDHGTVKWFSPRKHYGFITTEKGEDIFFHQRQLLCRDGGDLREGRQVRFHVQYRHKGAAALNVETLDDV